MRANDLMPPSVRRQLQRFGGAIAMARRRRRIPVELMLERTGLSKRTYQMVEKGDPRVAMAAYAMSLFALGLSHLLEEITDPARDDVGLLAEKEHLPKRIRARASRPS